MAKAKKLPSGNWRAIAFAGTNPTGKQLRKSFTAPTRKEAEYLASEWTMFQKEKMKPENMTVGEAIDQFIENRESVLSKTTVRGYKYVRKCRMAKIMDTKLCDLKNEDIQKAVNKDALRLKPKTVRNGFLFLSEVLNVFLPELVLKVDIPRAIAYENAIPNNEDVLLLLRETKGTSMYPAILLAACVGLRRSELCALTWDDIDEKTRTIRVNKALVMTPEYKWILKTTKTKASTRNIKIAESVFKELMALPRKGERIVTIKPDTVSNLFIQLRNRLGLTIRLHDLRHYNASVMLALNVPDKYAMKRGGWSTPNTMKKVYQHVFQDKQEEVDDTVNTYFDGLLGPGEGGGNEEPTPTSPSE